MKTITLLTFVVMGFLWPAQSSLANNTQASPAGYTVFLVRHAEKQKNSKNPELTSCGHQRANQLATMLEQANISAIYSTDYKRTQQTAAPMAKKLSLEVQSYSPRDLVKFADKIRSEKQNVLIVGHSNTSPQLAGLIANTSVSPITEKDYQMLYQVQFQGEQAKLVVLKQPLTCPN